METEQLMAAVKAALAEIFPKLPVITDVLPKDMKRPALTLELTEQETSPLNFALVQRRVRFLVTCFTKVNAYHDSSREELNRMQSAVMARFSSPMRAADRTLLPQVDLGEGGVDFTSVQVEFVWVDGRAHYIDEDTAPEQESGVPRMRDFAITVQGKDG